MRFYFKQFTVEEADGGDAISRRARIAAHSVLEWFDDLGVYHHLILSGRDVAWLSKMKISIKD